MGKWQLTTNLIGDDKIYGVYRVINENETDHSGNRETYGYFRTEEEAVEIMNELNDGRKL